MLAERNISLCISDHHDAPAPWERTADFVYLRGHGPGGRYEGRYSRATLAAWRKSIKEWQRGCHVNLAPAEREVEGLALVQAAVAARQL